jgi:hypothetical protein
LNIRAFVIVASLGLANCHSSTSPFSPAALARPLTTYTGAIQDSVKGTGVATLAVIDVTGLTTGHLDMSFAGIAEPTNTISGSVANGVYAALFCRDFGAHQ